MIGDILKDFGLRVKELRLRCGMSQEVLAERACLDRSYIGGVERGTRNISLHNIEKITAALNVSMSYFFSEERFSTDPAYLQKDFQLPFSERFKFHIDREKKLLSYQVNNLITANDADKMIVTLSKVTSTFKKGELKVFVDLRNMKDSKGEVAVLSPDIVQKSLIVQQKLVAYSSKAAVLCNSEFMVHQFNHIIKLDGGFKENAYPIFGEQKQMIENAYQLLDIHGHELIK